MAGSAFVLGGGGVLGAAEAGMAGALLEAGVVPDLICGTSIGAINGAALAADPTPDGAQQLVAMWGELAADGVLGGACPNCGGEMLRRPVRPAEKLARFPGSTTRKLRPPGSTR